MAFQSLFQEIRQLLELMGNSQVRPRSRMVQLQVLIIRQLMQEQVIFTKEPAPHGLRKLILKPQMRMLMTILGFQSLFQGIRQLLELTMKAQIRPRSRMVQLQVLINRHFPEEQVIFINELAPHGSRKLTLKPLMLI